MRNGYSVTVRLLLRVAVLAVLLVVGFAGGAYWLSLRTPTGFLPEEDQGAFFIVVQLPDGASVARTSDTTAQIEKLMLSQPQVAHLFGHRLFVPRSERRAERRVHGCAPEAVRRAHRAGGLAQALIARTTEMTQGVRTGNVFAFNLPPSSAFRQAAASSTSSKRWKARSRQDRQRDAGCDLPAANQDPRLTRVFSTFTASNPSIYLDIDRDKAQALGITISEFFTTLQATLGGFYVTISTFMAAPGR